MVAINNETHGGPNAEEPRRGTPDSARPENDVSRYQLLSATGAPKTKTLTAAPAGLIYQFPPSTRSQLSALLCLKPVFAGRPTIVRYIDPPPHKEGDHA